MPMVLHTSRIGRSLRFSRPTIPTIVLRYPPLSCAAPLPPLYYGSPYLSSRTCFQRSRLALFTARAHELSPSPSLLTTTMATPRRARLSFSLPAGRYQQTGLYASTGPLLSPCLETAWLQSLNSSNHGNFFSLLGSHVLASLTVAHLSYGRSLTVFRRLLVVMMNAHVLCSLPSWTYA